MSYVPLVDLDIQTDDGKRYWLGAVIGDCPQAAMSFMLAFDEGKIAIRTTYMTYVFPATSDEMAAFVSAFRAWTPEKPITVQGARLCLMGRPLRIRTMGNDGYALGTGPGIWMRDDLAYH